MAPINQSPGQDFGNTLDGPALQPPSGIIPNFDNPPNRNIYAHVALALGVSLASLFALLRAYARLFYLKKVHIADFIGLASFGTYLAFIYVLFDLLNSCGFFVHQWDMRIKDLITFNQLYFRGYMLYCSTVLTIKSAIIVEWIFIFVPAHTRNAFFWISHFLLWFNVLFYIAMIILPNVACHPHNKLWNPLLPGECINTTFSGTLISSVNLAVDAVLFILPQKVIWGLHMSTKRKLGVSLIFFIGVLACISAAFKVAASVPYNTSRDTSYTFAALGLWSHAEITCGILIFCMPSIPKTLTDIKLGDLASSLKSWAGSSMDKIKRSRSGSTAQASWHGVASRPSESSHYHGTSPKPSKSSMHQQARAYQQMDELSHPLPTSKPETVNNAARSSMEQDEVSSGNTGGAIIRTTQFQASETHNTNDSSDEYYRQHPWIAKQGQA